ncbi:DUF222 domain-containing protein [Microbispora sp. NPDC004025]
MDLFEFDPDRSRCSNNADGDWWDRLTAESPLWSSDGSAARDEAARDDNVENDAPTDSRTTDGRAADGRGRSSWVLVASVRESAQALALAPVPDDVDICLAEAEDLLYARDRITSAMADRVGRVHRAGQAKQHGHASTRSWLRTTGGMSVAGTSRLLTLGIELARLPRVREMFAAGGLAAGVAEAICAAISGLSDEQAGLAEPILVELAGRAGAAEVAKAGRYLRAVLDPDGEDRDERADYGRRFLRVRPSKDGGLEGEFYLPREHAARLQALLDAYARPKAEGDDRPLRVRQADAFMALLEEKIAAELLVLVNAESLPTDPTPEHAPEHAGSADRPASADRPEDSRDSQAGQDSQAGRDSEDISASAEEAEAAGSAVGAGADVSAGAAAEGGGGSTIDSAVNSADLATGRRDVQSGAYAAGCAQAKNRQRSESQQEPQQSGMLKQRGPQQRESQGRTPQQSTPEQGGAAATGVALVGVTVG